MDAKEALLNLLFPENIKCIACDEELWDVAKNGLCRKCSLKENTSFCLRCGRASVVSGRFCLACQKDNPPIAAARAPFVHEGHARNIVHGLKYGNRRYLAVHMARFMASYFLDFFWDCGASVAELKEVGRSRNIDGAYGGCAAVEYASSVVGNDGENVHNSAEESCCGQLDYSMGKALGLDFVTFAPMHKRKQNRRGYNQAELLAVEVARILGLSCVGVLDKLKDTKNTARLRAYQRREMLRGAIGVMPGVSFAGKAILLIDDVFTTGSTAYECAQKLLESDADKVFVLTFATSKARKR